jgi:hypothetical protein
MSVEMNTNYNHYLIEHSTNLVTWNVTVDDWDTSVYGTSFAMYDFSPSSQHFFRATVLDVVPPSAPVVFAAPVVAQAPDQPRKPLAQRTAGGRPVSYPFDLPMRKHKKAP